MSTRAADATYPALPGGQLRPVDPTDLPEPDASSVTGMIRLVRDLIAPHPAAEPGSPPEPMFRRLVEEFPVGICVIQDGRYRYVNPRLATSLGFSTEELLSLDSIADLVVEEDRALVWDSIQKRLQAETPTIRTCFRVVRKNGERLDVEAYATITHFQGRPAVLAVIMDVTARKRAEAQIAERIYKDPLTGLPNSLRMLQRLRQLFAEARRQKRRFGVVYLDLDRFKSVNDTWGHSAGDAILRQLAATLKRCVREADLVARVGGDEFVILMPDIQRIENLSAVARKLLTAVSRPVHIKGKAFEVTASIGIACYPEDSEDTEVLLRNADAAMYRAKELGRNRFQLCTAELTAQADERVALETGLKAALERDELAVHYQPILSLATGRIVGLEALVRWYTSAAQVVRPAAFISVAEESGLILPIGELVMRSACRQLREWQRTGLPDLRVAVNVSARQFGDAGLLQMIEKALSDSELSPEHLEVEITESIAMASAEIVVANLEALRERGVRISIDDFGTGYSSLNYLKRFPIHSLKIDRSFVTEVVTNPADAGIVRAIVEMAHGLKLNVVAEGVETTGQFQLLQRVGCDEMQGYWVSPPLTPEGISALLARELDFWAGRH